MGSQTDLDQGGTPRQWIRTYLGPSVGWIQLPGLNPLPTITAPGTYTLAPDTTLVQVNCNGAVIIILPSAQDPGVVAGVLPGLYAKHPVTIVDIGSHAQANPITIQPASGAENIMGLTSIQITVNYGGYTLNPSNAQKGWTSISP
jgi:hypothetical protein